MNGLERKTEVERGEHRGMEEVETETELYGEKYGEMRENWCYEERKDGQEVKEGGGGGGGGVVVGVQRDWR